MKDICREVLRLGLWVKAPRRDALVTAAPGFWKAADDGGALATEIGLGYEKASDNCASEATATYTEEAATSVPLDGFIGDT